MTTNTDALPSLLPCPFCAHEAQVTEGTGPFFDRVQVECSACRIATFWLDEDVAHRLWNRRTPAPEVQAEASAQLSTETVDKPVDRKNTSTPSAQAEAVRVDWIAVGEQWPKAEWDKYYHDDFSAPVAVMIDYNGHVRRSEVTWRYSFAHGGWVHADLREGWKPDDYSDDGRVTHWAPLPEPLAAPASSAGDQT